METSTTAADATAAADTAAGQAFSVGSECYTLAIPAAQFGPAIRAVATAADMSAHAPAGFDCVSFSVYADTGWEVAATDRYRLAVASSTESEVRVSNAIIPAKPLLAFAKSVKAPKRGYAGESVNVSLTTDLVSFAWNGASVSWHRNELHDTFPNYRKLLEPVTPADNGPSLWNPEFVADGMEACRIMAADKRTPVIWDCPNPSKPVTMRPDYAINGLSFVYLVMPRRSN